MIKIGILGSTGSIGKTTINIIKKNKKDFNVIFLTSNKNYKELLNQSLSLNVKNVVIHDKKFFNTAKQKFLSKKINVFNNINDLKKKVKTKIDYTMCSISGLEGLKPTLEIISITKNVAIANKESLICGWGLIKRSLKRYNTSFIPVDSEHFSIWSLIKNLPKNSVEEIIITGSGGPFLDLPLNKFKYITPSSAVKHPNWSMGKKISVDSSTLMNKVFEIIEAQKIFDIKINKFRILIHPNSYVHAIVKFHNGLIKVLIHETDMKIPIFNSIYIKNDRKIKTKKINLESLNNLNFKNVDLKKFPSVQIIKKVSNSNSLFETIIVSANDELVNLFLEKKITYLDISKYLNIITDLSIYSKYKRIKPVNYNQICELSKKVRLKTRSLCI